MADILERLGDLEKHVEQIGNAVTDRGSSLLDTRVAQQPNGAVTMSFFEDDGGTAPLTRDQMKSLRRIVGHRNRDLPPGYRSQFKSFSHFLRSGFHGEPEFEKLHKASLEQLKKSAVAMNTLDADSMGPLVLPEFAPDIAEVFYDENDLLGMTDQYTVAGNRMAFPRIPSRSRANGERNGGVTANWLDEGDAVVPSRGKIETTELRLKKLAVCVFLTEELLEDASYALETWVGRAVRSELKFMLGDAIVNGQGGGRPLGYMNSGAEVTVAKVGSQSNNTVVAQNILDMYARRRPGVPVGEYEWHINQNIEPQLHAMTLGTAGSQLVVYQPPGALASKPNATLMGLNVRTTEFNSPLGSKGDIALVRMKGYVTINKGGINEVASQHVEFLRQQTAIMFTLRVDGRPMQDAPTVPYKTNSADSQSDFIVLGERKGE